MSSRSSLPSRSDWQLRGWLIASLCALVVVMVVVSTTNSSSGALTTIRSGDGVSHPNNSKQDLSLGQAKKARSVSKNANSTTTTPSAVPGAVSGVVTRPKASSPCGFALAQRKVAQRFTGRHKSRKALRHMVSVTSPIGKCTVLEIGDSLGNDLGWGLERHLGPSSGLNLVQDDVSSTGLVNTSFFNWSSHLAADLKAVHPQLVLISLGGNDEQGMDVNGAAVQFPSPAWTTAYTNRVRQLIKQATNSGAYVLWVGLPIMQPPSYNQGMQILDSIYEKAVKSSANATFVSTWSLFSNPQGTFQTNARVNGVPTTLRESDGIHYSFSGEDIASTYVLREMAMIYHVKLVPTNPAVVTSWG